MGDPTRSAARRRAPLARAIAAGRTELEHHLAAGHHLERRLELLRAENVRLSHRAELAEMETELLRTSLDDLRSVISKLPPALEAGRPKRWFRR